MSRNHHSGDNIVDGFLKNQIEAFCAILMIPEFMLSWLHLFYEPREIRLILALNRQPPSGEETESRGSWMQQLERTWSADFLTRCYRRAVIDLDEERHYTPADFHARYEIWALFEGWQDVPRDIKDRLNQWELQYFIETRQPRIDAFEKTGQRDQRLVWPEYVLLDEALALIQKVPHLYLWPCNCRAMIKGCQKPGFVCLRFENDRNLGWEISKERAREILLAAHKKGLMQSAEIGIAPDGSIQGAICNCCSDCCLPVQFSRQLNEPGLYPLIRYVAHLHVKQCSTCGRCVRRCPFKALTLSNKDAGSGGDAERQIHFNADLCRGCGLCSTACPEGAIEMLSLEPSALSMVSRIWA